jgi:cytochrome c peroxidase
MLFRLALAVLVIPAGLDLYIPVPADNPITNERIERGRRLFADRRLSRDGTIACASCHIPDLGFSDGRRVAIGVLDRAGRRNTPALINRAYGQAFFWDGRATTLEEQVVQPIQDPNEMDLTLAEASVRVGMPVDEIARSLATFVRSLLSGNSAFDRYVAGDRDALDAEQRRGLQLFQGKARCTACHVGPTFSDERFHNTGIAWPDGRLADPGRGAVTGRSEEAGAFKTPTLREVARTAPYMHDGSIASLNDVIEFYDRGGNANPSLDADLRPLRLTDDERRALARFLESLNGSPAGL